MFQCLVSVLFSMLCFSLLFFKEMSENRFKVSKTDPDGTKEPKDTYRRVNLSTGILK